MVRRALAVFFLSILSIGCGDEVDQEAQSIWDVANGELHRLHGLAFSNGGMPDAMSAYSCKASGVMNMEITYVGEKMDTLLHTFEDCEVDGSFMSGRLDYTELATCEDGSFSFRIEGQVRIEGNLESDCQFEGAEVCGKVTGTVCDRVAH